MCIYIYIYNIYFYKVLKTYGDDRFPKLNFYETRARADDTGSESGSRSGSGSAAHAMDNNHGFLRGHGRAVLHQQKSRR